MIHVLISAEYRLYRAGLAALLRGAAGIAVVAESATATQVPVETVVRRQPDVLVVDVAERTDHPSRLDTVAEIRERVPSCRVVLLADVSQPRLIRRAMDLDVLGVLEKDTPPRELVGQIRRIAAGERIIDTKLAIAALAATSNPLTEREMAVLRILAEGATATETAQKLVLAVGTVRNHISRVMSKANARTRVDAVRVAKESGWI
jgi:two-component system response regulator DesR